MINKFRNLWEKVQQHWARLWEPPRFLGFKICAVLMAILVWIYVMDTQNPMTEESYTVPVEVRDLSPQLAIPDTKRQVTIRVQGSSSVMGELSSRDISAYCDFSNVSEGEATLPVELVLPEGVTLVNLMPESMSFELNTVVSRSFPVETHINGDAAASYRLLDPVLAPAMVNLSGSEEYLDQVASVFVSADVEGLTENYSRNLAVEVLDHNGNNISAWFTCAPVSVDVMIPVVYEQPEKSIAISPSYVGTPALGYRISRVVVEPATVRAFGALDVLNNLYYVETETVDVNDLKKTTSFTVDLKHGNNVSLSTDRVTVVVQIEPEATVSVKKELVYYENLAEGLVCTLPNIELEMTLSGVDADISNLDTNEVVPYVDLGQISGPGSYTLLVQVNQPANVSLLSCDPATVEVSVTEVSTEPGAEGGNPAAPGGETSSNPNGSTNDRTETGSGEAAPEEE